jgi:hypothetical protein
MRNAFIAPDQIPNTFNQGNEISGLSHSLISPYLDCLRRFAFTISSASKRLMFLVRLGPEGGGEASSQEVYA